MTKDLENFPYVMLVIVIGGTLFAMFCVLKGRSEAAQTVGGRVAHGPAEFPEVFNDPLLGGPPPGGSGVDEQGHYSVPPPPFSEGVFPCSECHKELTPDATVRKLEMAHEEIALNHGGENRWCFDCHNPDDRDRLKLANGTLVPFEESYRLCGQCHGEIYRDWREGIHGRRTGNWDGAKKYLLCAHCHNPHNPQFKPIAPLPPPVRPDFLKK